MRSDSRSNVIILRFQAHAIKVSRISPQTSVRWKGLCFLAGGRYASSVLLKATEPPACLMWRHNKMEVFCRGDYLLPADSTVAKYSCLIHHSNQWGWIAGLILFIKALCYRLNIWHVSLLYQEYTCVAFAALRLCKYTTGQKFGIIRSFWKKSLMVTKTAFIQITQ